MPFRYPPAANLVGLEARSYGTHFSLSSGQHCGKQYNEHRGGRRGQAVGPGPVRPVRYELAAARVREAQTGPTPPKVVASPLPYFQYGVVQPKSN
jgi:hypothetical protein